jgi:hypothetical protein
MKVKKTLLGLYVSIEPAVRNTVQIVAGIAALHHHVGGIWLGVTLLVWAAVDMVLKGMAGWMLMRKTLRKLFKRAAAPRSGPSTNTRSARLVLVKTMGDRQPTPVPPGRSVGTVTGEQDPRLFEEVAGPSEGTSHPSRRGSTRRRLTYRALSPP